MSASVVMQSDGSNRILIMLSWKRAIEKEEGAVSFSWWICGAMPKMHNVKSGGRKEKERMRRGKKMFFKDV